MNRGLAVFGTIGVAALLIFAVPRGQTASHSTSAFGGRETVQPLALRYESDITAAKGYMTGRDLLQVFVGRSSDPRPKSERDPLDIIVATLPDPFDSRLDWMFDWSLEGIIRAFERAGYVVDRFWLPAQLDSVRVPVGHPLPTTAPPMDSIWAPAREAYPGVFLFRKQVSDTVHTAHLRLLYVVPEIPTGGIYRAVLARALDERAALLAPESDFPAVDYRILRIVGPSFSGSSFSLRRTLDQWLELHPGSVDSVRIVSGSATNDGNQTRLSSTGDTIPKLIFHSTVNSDGAYGRAFDSLFRVPLGLQRSDVALLHESSTEYGQGAGDTTVADDNTQSLRIPFPMNISSVRAEYARQPEIALSNELGFTPVVRSRTQMSLEVEARPKETPLARSDLTPASVELMIEQIVRTLKNRDIRAVGILATDVRDKLFLGKEIRRQMRDVQLFTYESSILFLRRDLNRYMRGMYVISTYPLVQENQSWVGDLERGGGFAFPNDGAVGIHNATLIQLGKDSALVEYRVPGETASVQPPVWLTRVGRTSMVPVDFLSLDSNYVAERVPLRGDDETSHASITFIALVVYLAFGVGLACVAFFFMQAQKKKTEECVSDIPLQYHWKVYRVILLLALFCAFLPIATLLTARAVEGLHPEQFDPYALLFVVFSVGVALYVAWALWVTVYTKGATLKCVANGLLELLRKPEGVEPEPWPWRAEVVLRLIVMLSAIGYLGLILWFCFKIGFMQLEGDVEWWIFFHRAIKLDSGVSPLMPLMLGSIGYAVWAFWHIRRIEQLDTKKETPFELCALGTPPAGPDGENVKEAVAAIRNRSLLLVPNLWAAMLHMVVFVVAILLIFRFGASLERENLGRSFDFLLRFCVLGGLVAISLSTYRMGCAWHGLRSFLEVVSRLPLVTAFERLPARVARLIGVSVFKGSAATPIDGATRIQWDQLKNLYVRCMKEGNGERIAEGEAESLKSAEKHADHGITDDRERVLIAKMGVLFASQDNKDASNESPVPDGEGKLGKVCQILTTAWAMEPGLNDVDILQRELGRSGSDARFLCTSGRLRQTFAGSLGLWLRLAEEYLAARIVEYVETILEQLRRLALSLLASMLLATALFSSYPFFPQSRLKLILFLTLLGTVGTVLTVMVQMSRDEVLSRIGKTRPGKITWDAGMALSLVIFGIVPLLFLAGSEFPVINQLFTSWMDPMMRLLRMM